MTQTPEGQNTADFQAQNREQLQDQDSEPTTMAPDDARPDLVALNDDSEAQEPDGADEASPS